MIRWLFFDEVDYIFARRSAWPGYPPAWAQSSRDFALARPEVPTEELESLVERVRACLDGDLRGLVQDRVPDEDARYAVDAVSMDDDLRPVREKAGLGLDPAFALGFLTAKLMRRPKRPAPSRSSAVPTPGTSCPGLPAANSRESPGAAPPCSRRAGTPGW